MTAPIVTVIIPVSPAHVSLLPDALSSVKAQTVDVAQVIVVNDTTQQVFPQGMPYPVDLISTGGGRWTSVARNMALAKVTTPFVTFLDADDGLVNTTLEMMIRAYAMWGGGYIYGDAFTVSGGKLGYSPAPEYSRQLITRRNIHTVTALVPTRFAKAVGGFDETLHGWEDWEFYIRLAEAGYCGKRVPQPFISYRLDTGHNRNRSYEIGSLINYVRERHANLFEGVFEMGCCGGDPQAQDAAQAALAKFAPASLNAEGKVPMEYIGDKHASVTYNANGRSYEGGLSRKYFAAEPQDVEKLESFGVFRRMPVNSTTPKAPELKQQYDSTTDPNLPPVAPFKPAAKSVAPTEAPKSVAPTAKK